MAGNIRGKQMRDADIALSTKGSASSITADATGRALFAADFFNNSTTVAAIFSASSIGLDRLEEAVIQADGGQAFTGNQSMGSNNLTNLAAATASGHAVEYDQWQAGLAGLDWQGPTYAAIDGYIGTRTIVQINALTPVLGMVVVAADAGTPTAGASDALVAGSVAEFDGTSWQELLAGSGGFVPNKTRLVVSTDNAIFSPLTDAADDGKIADFDGTSNTPTLTTPSDGWAILVNGEGSVDENQAYTFDGVVPTGVWVQFTGAGAVNYETVGNITTINAGDAADAGSNNTTARGDHQHAVSTGTPGTIEPDDAAVEGVATSLARSDHQHAIATAAAGTAAIGDVAAEGSSTSFARADHTHAISGGSPVTVGTALADGSNTTFARSDHVHSAPSMTPIIGPDATASVTTGDGDQATASTFTTGSLPALADTPVVTVNGVEYSFGFATTGSAFYASGDGGSSARASTSAIANADTLHFNGSVAGFQLDANDDITVRAQNL